MTIFIAETPRHFSGGVSAVPVLDVKVDDGTVFFQPAISASGSAMHARFASGDPFPHIVIDDFLPVAVLDRLLAEWPEPHHREGNRHQHRLKSQFDPDEMTSSFARSLFYAFNGAPFLQFIEGVTGFSGLLPDPYFVGGGFHEIRAGGHLSVHADFNLRKPLRVLRRINLLVYLNKDWRPEYCGNLELWSKDMKTCVKSIEPIFNRCVIFHSTSDSFHGHPEPLRVPEGKTRRSIALYYYTASEAGVDERRFHTTIYKVRPNSNDKFDAKFMFRDILVDWTPPILKRTLNRLTHRTRTP